MIKELVYFDKKDLNTIVYFDKDKQDTINTFLKN
jgi:hypothetical protein